MFFPSVLSQANSVFSQLRRRRLCFLFNHVMLLENALHFPCHLRIKTSIKELTRTDLFLQCKGEDISFNRPSGLHPHAGRQQLVL